MSSPQRFDLRRNFPTASTLLLAVFWIASAQQILGQSRIFAVRSLSVDDGLSQSHVTAFAQDTYGYIWIGTAVGLNRYNGHEFEVFRHSAEKADSLSSDAVYALHVDAKGRLWVGTDVGLDRYEPATNSFRHYSPATATNRQAVSYIRAIDSDAEGNIWVGLGGWADTAQVPVVRLQPDSGRAQSFLVPVPKNSPTAFLRAMDASHVAVICSSVPGTSSSSGLAIRMLDPATGAVTPWSIKGTGGAPDLLGGEKDISVAKAGPRALWVGAPGNQIYLLDIDKGELSPYVYDAKLPYSPGTGLVSHVVAGIHGDVWVIPTWSKPGQQMSGNVIYRLAPATGTAEKNSLRPAGACDLTRNFLIASFIDRTGILWGGLSGAGACVSDLESGMFTKIDDSTPNIRLSNNFVRAVWKTTDGILWVGTRVGLNRIDRRNMQVRVFLHQPNDSASLSDDELTAVFVDGEKTLWVGTQTGGLNRDDGLRGVFQHYRAEPGNPKALQSDYIKSILEDRGGTLWLATTRGLSRFDRSTQSFSTYLHVAGDPHSITSDKVTALLEDSKGGMWVGTEEGGLNRFDRKSGKFGAVDLGLPPNVNIVSLVEDPFTPGAVWISTLRHGLMRYDAASGHIARYLSQNSLLPSDTVYSVLSDDHGGIWAGTNRGLVRIDLKSDSMRLFGADQGLQSMEFNTRACFRAADGELLMGGVGGLNVFYPRSLTQNNFAAPVVITSVRAINRSGRDSSNPYRSIYRNGGPRTAGELDAASRELIFSFFAPHFSDPGRNTYRFRLVGFEEAWRDAGTAREVTYTNLSPGHYQFQVKAVTSRGVWSQEPTTYDFDIAKPVWQTFWFISFSAMVFFGTFFLLHRMRLRRLKEVKRALETTVRERTSELTNAMAVIEEQTVKLRHSDELKSRFITNVSHDFRTPLAVTLGVLSDIRQGACGPLSEAAALELDVVIRNEKRLLRLVNQLLAVARIDSGKLHLELAECDLGVLAKEVVSLFLPAAKQKGLRIECDVSESLLVQCDREWMEQVIANLLVNAVKFSPDGGRIQVRGSRHAETQSVFLEVSDEGPGIPTEDLTRIFDRYYQSEMGATTPHVGIGVGLSLAKEIVDLHGGEILACSEPQHGSVFQIRLQAGPPQPVAGVARQGTARSLGSAYLESLAEDLLHQTATPLTQPADEQDRPTVVLAEDDADLRQYLAKHLQETYRVLDTASGDEAWALVKAETPDLVVSDIMMPGMDGYQLCQEIRGCRETDFIPVILLTAKASLEDRLKGLSDGADDYLAKPFEMAELKARISNIISGRARIKTRLAADMTADSAKAFGPVPESADAAFLRTVYEVLQEQVGNPEFTVEQLAEELTVSRMHLYRRLKEITGKSPAEVLMEYRLERASQLLAARAGNVSEVAYSIGFKSLAHFTRRFRDKFGCTPSEYRSGKRQPAPAD